MMIHFCAGKILVQDNIASVDVRLRPFSAQFQTKDDICMAPQGIIYMSKLKNTQDMKYV